MSDATEQPPQAPPTEQPPPAADPAPPPPAEGGEPQPKPAPKVSQGFLDAKRAMSLKWAIQRGTHKDGSPISDEDRAWYAAREAERAARPPKPPKLGVIEGGAGAGVEADPPFVGKMPRPDTPPRVDPDPPKPPKGEGGKKSAGGGWQERYRKEAMKLAEFPMLKRTDGTVIDEREFACAIVTSIPMGLLKAAEDALALIGAKPFGGFTCEKLWPAAILVADQRLPPLAKITPEQILAAGAACIVAPVVVNWKAIRTAQKAAKEAASVNAKRDEMKARTAAAEAEYEAKQAAARVAPPAPPPKPTPTVIVETKANEDSPDFEHPTDAAQQMAREHFDPEREVKLPPGHII